MGRIAWLAVAIGLVVAGGCGSSGSKSSKAQSAATTAATSQAASTTPPSFSGSSGSHYCQLAKDVEKKNSAQPNTDLKASFAQFDSEASQFLAAVPSSIKTDAQTLVDGIKKYEQVLQKANFDVTKVNPADLQTLQDPKFQQAAQ